MRKESPPGLPQPFRIRIPGQRGHHSENTYQTDVFSIHIHINLLIPALGNAINGTSLSMEPISIALRWNYKAACSH
jgi:hypothetical protein